MKIAVITANIGGFDTVKSIPKQTIEFDRYYYTEEDLPVPMHTQDARMKAKLMKICPHWFLPDYDVYVWIDGNVQVKSKFFIEYMINTLQGNDIAISKHPSRSDIYHEAAFICDSIKSGSKYLSDRYSIESIQKEIQSIGEGHGGLYWNGLSARVNNTWINKCHEQWFLDNVLYSNFDQLSFVKMVNNCKLKLGIFDMGSNFYNNDNYELIKHLK